MALYEYNTLFNNGSKIGGIYKGGNLIWPVKYVDHGPDYTEPFYVENITNTNETLRIVKSQDNAVTLTIEYSENKTVWKSLGTTSTTALTKELQPGEKVWLRCNANFWCNGTNVWNSIQGISKVGGNILSLRFGNNFNGQTELHGPSDWSHLFQNNNTLKSANSLLLSPTTLASGNNSCKYSYMFYNCTSLTTAPALPATTLKEYCYEYMFYNCTSLTTAPALPATTLTNYCYQYMFRKCTSLLSAPDLMASSLVKNCYYYMFYGCSKLNYVRCTAKSGINSNNSTKYWVKNIAGSGTFYKNSGTTWPSGVNGIPSGWTVVEQ